MAQRNHALTTGNPSSIIKEMEEMFLRLRFSQLVTQKLVDDQGIDSPRTLTDFSDLEIATICNVIRMPGGLVSGKMPDSKNQISILIAKNLELAAFMFKMMECCSRTYGMRCINSTLCCRTSIRGGSIGLCDLMLHQDATCPTWI